MTGYSYQGTQHVVRESVADRKKPNLIGWSMCGVALFLKHKNPNGRFCGKPACKRASGRQATP